MSRKPIENTVVPLIVFCDVQDNGDGTWTASVRLPSQDSGPVTRDSRDLALLAASRIYSAVNWEILE